LYAGGFKAPACNSLSFLVAARGVSAALGGFGFALKTAATFDVFYWLQVTNYGVLYVSFDSAPSGSNYIDVWDLCLHAQTASTIISSQPLATNPDESKPKSCLIACAKDACITDRLEKKRRAIKPHGEHTEFVVTLRHLFNGIRSFD
jgi:hypothetical protein